MFDRDSLCSMLDDDSPDLLFTSSINVGVDGEFARCREA